MSSLRASHRLIGRLSLQNSTKSYGLNCLRSLSTQTPLASTTTTSSRLPRAARLAVPSLRYPTSARFFSSTPRSLTTSSDIDWNQNEDFFKHTGGKFLFNAKQGFADRYVKFDMNLLAAEAAKSVGASSVVTIEKLPEHQYNKRFLMTMDDGQTVVAQVPNPVAGKPGKVTASEVATMDFVRHMLGLPVPRVLAYNARKEDSPVGAEYIIMEKAEGVPLREKWAGMSAEDRAKLLDSLVEIEKKFISKEFEMNGSLYYEEDLVPGTYDEILFKAQDLEAQAKGVSVPEKRFAIGPSTSRTFWGSSEVSAINFDRGPWYSPNGYLKACAKREIQLLETLGRPACSPGIFGPGTYHPTTEESVKTLKDFISIIDYIVPKDKTVTSPSLWHHNLTLDNIWVSPDSPTTITSLTNWQTTHLKPLFLTASHPSFLNFPGQKPTIFDLPAPPSTEGLSEEEIKQKNLLFQKQLDWHHYENQTLEVNDRVYMARQHSLTPSGYLFAFVETAFYVGTPLIQHLLYTIYQKWPEFEDIKDETGKVPPCPLSYTEAEIKEYDEKRARWTEAIIMLRQVLESLGVDVPATGWVESDKFLEVMEKYDFAKKGYVELLGDTEEEKKAWAEAWPFKDMGVKREEQ
ncbi:hypothetical protein BJ508DRAFT_413682 [Ascobolus immersus RN42]|uniref:Altered inheritance of mitochondria protein 9, mitochondrial n=1 Tax=Ascobolus immersus RN42 TaxID=1160509 RepID=A0A3N4IAA0_ASCIM|nr:hypothetical protein BJ508DRAFT_413682 [Ascobolus immersus RN42]